MGALYPQVVTARDTHTRTHTPSVMDSTVACVVHRRYRTKKAGTTAARNSSAHNASTGVGTAMRSFSRWSGPAAPTTTATAATATDTPTNSTACTRLGAIRKHATGSQLPESANHHTHTRTHTHTTDAISHMFRASARRGLMGVLGVHSSVQTGTSTQQHPRKGTVQGEIHSQRDLGPKVALNLLVLFSRRVCL